MLVCTHCGGAGWTQTCEACRGRGRVQQGGMMPWTKCNHCHGAGKFQASPAIKAPRKRPAEMSKEEMQSELRKMGRKVSGSKQCLQQRLHDVFESNDRGWASRTVAACSGGQYLSSGSFRDVYLMEYTKGPRKGEKGVYKLFKDAACDYDRQTLKEETQAVKKAGQLIKAFNAHNDRVIAKRNLGARRRVYLNKPEIWEMGDRKVFVEPLIEGRYAKFNSNSGWINDGYQMMQALSHFSFHHSRGRYLLCDLQGV
mmetsp:Transcript_71767/g.126697  ORF Transcript_71767/g.126697 Transcript_71767/m.126697 type:complete len:255 (-) Transcript_71767:314-1078(-)